MVAGVYVRLLVCMSMCVNYMYHGGGEGRLRGFQSKSCRVQYAQMDPNKTPFSEQTIKQWYVRIEKHLGGLFAAL